MTKSHAAFLEEASALRALARDRETVWSFGDFILPSGMTHAEEEAEDDDFDITDAHYVLKSCKISGGDFSYDGWRYRALGKNVDGILLTFVVIFSREPKKIHVRTCWANR